jgi:predicted nucleic acid-binding protein
MQSDYLDTSIIGYLASRLSSDLITAGKQRRTRDWWDRDRGLYRLFVSQAVIMECDAGDATAAAERHVYLDGVAVLETSPEDDALAKRLLSEVPLPAKARVDALHIAIAALNGMDYLLTWNCKHIDNPALRRQIEQVLAAHGAEPPIICTPEEFFHE